MKQPIDELYFNWLYSQTGSTLVRNPTRTHWELLKQLYNTPFVWIVPHDDNRVADGKDLRLEFMHSCGISDVDQNWLDLDCSMLELLVVLARILVFEADGRVDIWFWHLIEQLHLERYNDAHYDQQAQEHVRDTLDRVIYRRYSANGKGGLFPLRNPPNDQREVELWYQLSAYLNELI